MTRDRSKGRSRGVLGLLDIGTSKNACLIVALDRGAAVAGRPSGRVVGLGHKRSRGIKAGVITDLEHAEQAVRACVGDAERMAGVTLDAVLVAVGCGRIRSQTFAANAEIANGIVADADIARVLSGGHAYVERDGRRLLHMNRIAFRLDGAPGASNPRGMAARRLTADLTAVTADEAPLRNIAVLLDRCFLGLDGFVASPYASALAVTSAEERRLGVTAIDIGAGTTKIGMFVDGHLIAAEVVPVGSDHITYDIARALRTPLAEAERIKALYGTVLFAQSDEHEVFSYPLADEEGYYQATKAQLARIVAQRAQSLFGLIEERLDRSGMRHLAGRRFVLTGGGAELVGLAELAANRLREPVRVAGPSGPSGLPQAVRVPAFATVVGLLQAAEEAERAPGGQELAGAGDGYLGRVGRWLMEGL
ncbi:MAG: cell division protein FtsA [Hyphomicrobiaceae bacterium]|nr:cell division protein FtsA [Hyphomicrobiaceae bacterium]